MDFQLRGKWWIPSNPVKQIIGVLTSEQNSNPTLKLEVNSFWDDPWAKVSPQLILGELEDKTKVTLYKGHTETSVPISLSFRIDFVFRGIHFDSADEIIFESIDIRYSDIDNCLPIHYSDIDNCISIHDLERYSSSNQSTQKPIRNRVISADIGQGFIVDLVEEVEHFAKPRTYVKIKSSNGGKHFDDYFKMKNIIQDFLSLALARPIHTLSMVGEANTSETRLNDTKMHEHQYIQIYHAEFSDPLIAKRKYDGAVFLFRHISGNFDV